VRAVGAYPVQFRAAGVQAGQPGRGDLAGRNAGAGGREAAQLGAVRGIGVLRKLLRTGGQRVRVGVGVVADRHLAGDGGAAGRMCLHQHPLWGQGDGADPPAAFPAAAEQL
jgi:hypothetical protein